MAYRDGFESCPRCGVVLEDAGSARACSQCRGLWVEHAVVSEMVHTMLPTGELGRLQLAVVFRAERLACPTCQDQMDPTTIHEVVLDACGKGHGVWFDANELEQALQAVARAGLPPPGFEITPPAPSRDSAASFQPTAQEDETLPVLYLREIVPRDGLAQRFRQDIIKIGRLSTAHVKIADDSVSRMHAVIEMSPERVRIIDLGSSSGTLVDSEKVNTAELRDGSRIQLGDVVFEARIDR